MKVNFTSLNSNIKLGRAAIKSVRQDYPFGFLSNSKYEAFSNRVNPKLDRFLSSKILETRDQIDFEKRLGVDGLTAVENVVKRTKAANCGEQAYILSKKLNENGVANQVVIMQVKKGKKIVDTHTFCVIGLDKDAKIAEPKSWGKDAVIADLWLNSVDGVKKSLNQFFKIMNFNKREDNLLFYSPFI